MTETTATAVSLGPSGLVLDGGERVRLCASLFYFRVPRESWPSRLAAVRASGYDLVDVYVPWNFHEIAPGRWDFEGRRDVAAFLDLAHAVGLKVVARPGPYICSEWDGGALPAWLALEEGLRLRQHEPRYLAHVEAWFDRILPLLAAREHGRGGAVVAVQLENELDFFDCEDRAGYVGRLRDLALRHGIGVPLVACAGQGDLTGATGDVDGVVPAVNFYPDDRSPFVEPEVRRYADLTARRRLPLLVTETNRRHATLRRLVVSGAKVVAPYLQASGYDFGWTPSVGNWGDPGGFMSHDYDFGGYLDPVGAPRPEHAEARVLSAVLRTLGPALARATPEAAPGAYTTDVATSASPSRLVLDGGGELLGVPNLTEEWGTVTLPAPAEGDAARSMPASENGSAPVAEDGSVTVPLPPASCLLVLRDLPLAGFGLPGTLRLTTADLVGAGPDGLTLSARGTSALVLDAVEAVETLDRGTRSAWRRAATPGAAASAELAAPAPGTPVRTTLTAAGATWPVIVLHPDDVGEASATAPTGSDPTVVETATRLDLATRTGTTTRHDLPPSSEALGVFRGRTHYGADIGGLAELLLQGTSDIADLTLDDDARPALARFGATTLVPVAGARRLEATVETWGHANFDDVRLPALRMGSLRGIGRVWSVTGRTDVSALWEVTGPGTWPGDPAPLRGLAGWSSTRAGTPVTYRRGLPTDGASHHALRLDGLDGPADVAVDGVTHLVTADEPWLTLAPGEGSDVAVTVPHRPGAALRAELLRLEPVRGWDVEPQPDDALLALAATAATGERVRLPLDLAPGDEAWFDVEVPTGGLSLRLEGRQIRVSAFAAGELLGRVWLDDPARPRFTGGDSTRIWLPAAWNTGAVRFMVRATRGEESPQLGRVRATAVSE
ncbi:beta-galactosidase [Myceligenerans pegani]|uniref:Beta-galactosidase n=1 Tax=Myceligenerans pegani TaxID=2776917 RepID=A0ABR9MXH8_9MICO|nr:beta-galactosidase [Myceligenerans sp. TRM 65318]MBE1876078.1 beta-galactosidase [Myceligenerans sp. TRM 65318]MBE3018349.1 beta-galactosidase [Myceligenerans sp. TRM 65318]